MGKPFYEMTKEELSEAGKKNGKVGGKASVIAKRKRKEAKEIYEIFLNMSLKSGKVADIEKIQNFMAMKGKNITVDQAVSMQVVQRALKGDLQAYQIMMSYIGEKPAENINIKANIPVVISGDDDLQD